MPIICVDIVLERDGRVLLLKRKNLPARNQWWFPGGRIAKGEAIEQAALRKVREEIGLVCKFKGILGVEETYFEKQDEMEFDIHTINIVVELEPLEKNEPIIDKDHVAYNWQSYNSWDFHPAIQNILAKKGLVYLDKGQKSG